ncbi:hypothetical protein ACWDFH_09955 [Streptomyces kronopolitis]|uniref:hypothetical protein n=1 Tax=Streptomyces kronopolitis TaxID=1612435 RepID=UPI00341292A2
MPLDVFAALGALVRAEARRSAPHPRSAPADETAPRPPASPAPPPDDPASAAPGSASRTRGCLLSRLLRRLAALFR